LGGAETCAEALAFFFSSFLGSDLTADFCSSFFSAAFLGDDVSVAACGFFSSLVSFLVVFSSFLVSYFSSFLASFLSLTGAAGLDGAFLSSDFFVTLTSFGADS